MIIEVNIKIMIIKRLITSIIYNLVDFVWLGGNKKRFLNKTAIPSELMYFIQQRFS